MEKPTDECEVISLFESASRCRSESSSGVSIVQDSPESIVGSQDLGSVPWWAHLIKMHTKHLKFDDSRAAPVSLLSTCSGMLAEAFALKAGKLGREGVAVAGSKLNLRNYADSATQRDEMVMVLNMLDC